MSCVKGKRVVTIEGLHDTGRAPIANALFALTGKRVRTLPLSNAKWT